MSNILIKIVEIHQPTNSVIVKFASDSSTRPIDDYDGLAFQLSNLSSTTPADFIKEVSPYLSYVVAERDRSEKPKENIELSSWVGFSGSVPMLAQVAPATAEQLLPGLVAPEVTL